MANKQLKKLLHLAVISAIIHNKELRIYHLKRISEGKKISTINILHNKILARIFAPVNGQAGYVELTKYAAYSGSVLTLKYRSSFQAGSVKGSEGSVAAVGVYFVFALRR